MVGDRTIVKKGGNFVTSLSTQYARRIGKKEGEPIGVSLRLAVMTKQRKNVVPLSCLIRAYERSP